MIALTTIQQDILTTLLQASKPIALAELRQHGGMTVRQVQYSLRSLEMWIQQRGGRLVKTPNVGVRIIASVEQKQAMLTALTSERSFYLILTAGQRQQILALDLLTTNEPRILQQLQQRVDASRTTLLKDLEIVEQWLKSFGLVLKRRPNYGFWLEGDELAVRQALAALLWSDTPFADPMFMINHSQGLVFLPSNDATLSPAIKHITDQVSQWNIETVMQYIAFAETETNVRFTDEAVLQMALAFAVQRERVLTNRLVIPATNHLDCVHSRSIWQVALQLGQHMLPTIGEAQRINESGALAMYLLSAARESSTDQNLLVDDDFAPLIDELMRITAQMYRIPALEYDQIFRNGLESHVVPACWRHRFGLWAPSNTSSDLDTEQWVFERSVAERLGTAITELSGCVLPPIEQNNLVLLVRAAAIRERPAHPHRVLICCPTGMATTQLLVARLKVRFPHLGSFEVISLRDLNSQRLADADLIITTVPLQLPAHVQISVLQVHPMLSPQDIDVIRTWIAQHAEGPAHLPV